MVTQVRVSLPLPVQPPFPGQLARCAEPHGACRMRTQRIPVESARRMRAGGELGGAAPAKRCADRCRGARGEAGHHALLHHVQWPAPRGGLESQAHAVARTRTSRACTDAAQMRFTCVHAGSRLSSISPPHPFIRPHLFSLHWPEVFIGRPGLTSCILCGSLRLYYVRLACGPPDGCAICAGNQVGAWVCACASSVY